MNSRRIQSFGIDPTSLALAERLRRRERAGRSDTLANASFANAAHSFGDKDKVTLDFDNAVVLSAGMSKVLSITLRRPMAESDPMDLIRIKQLSSLKGADSVLIKANNYSVDIEFILDISEWGSQSNTEVAFLNADMSNREALASEGIPLFPVESDALSTLKMVNNAEKHFLLESATSSEIKPLRIYQRPYMYEDVVFIEIDKDFPLSPLSFSPSMGVDSYDILISNLTQVINSIGVKGKKQIVLVLSDNPRDQVIAAINFLKKKIERMNGNLVVLLPEERVFSNVDGMNRLKTAGLESFADRNSALKRLEALKFEVVIPCPDSGWGLIEKPKPTDYGFHIQFNYNGAISQHSNILLGAVDEDFKALARLRNILRKERRLLIDLGSIEIKDLTAAEYLKVSMDRLSGLHSVIFSNRRKTMIELGEHRVEVYDDIDEARKRLNEDVEPLKHQHHIKAFNVKPLSNSFLFTCNQHGLGADNYIKQEFPRDTLIMEGVKGRADGRAAIILDFGELEFLTNESFHAVRDAIRDSFKDIPFIVLAENDFTRLSFQAEGIPVCEHMVEGKEYLDDQMAKTIIPPPRGWNYIEVPEFFGDGFEILFNKKILDGHIKSAIREDFYALATTTSKKQLAYRSFIINFKTLGVDPDEIPLIKECLKLLDDKKMHYVTLSENAKTRELFTKSKIQVVETREDAMDILPLSPIRI